MLFFAGLQRKKTAISREREGKAIFEKALSHNKGVNRILIKDEDGTLKIAFALGKRGAIQAGVAHVLGESAPRTEVPYARIFNASVFPDGGVFL